MSGVEFKPCGGTNSSEPNILLPLGKSVVGRGPLLAIADKRVSRNHGIMEVEDGKIKIMPTHTNPTFYQASGADKLTALEKDIWKVLDHGDRISLTPDQHIFEVIIQDRPVNTSTQSLNTSIVEPSPEKIAIKPAKPDNKAKTDGDKKVEEQQNGDDKNADEDRSTEGEEQKEEKGEAEKEAKEDSKDGEDTNGVHAGDESLDSANPDKEKVETVKLEDGKVVALPVQKERTLPDWMDKTEGGKVPEKKTDTTANPDPPKRRGRPKKEGTPVKQSAQSPKSSPEEETPPKKGKGKPKGPSNKGKGRGRPRKRAAEDVNEEEEEEGEEVSPPASKALNRDKRKKYAEDYVEEDMEEEEETKIVYKDDDDWMLSEDEVESDISDWESSQKTPKSKAKAKAKKSPKKKGGRGKPPKITRTPSRRTPARGKKVTKSYFTDSEDDYFSHDDEVYVPKPTKRTAGKVASSQSQQSVESGEAEGDDDRLVKAAPKAKKRAKSSKKVAKIKKKKSCEYGSDCYRKNPSHFKNFCHPGDPGYKSAHSSEGEKEEGEKEDGEDEGDKDKEECPYGVECYRTNKAHLKQYRHAPQVPTNRPKREAAQKKAMVIQGDRSSLLHSGVSDDDGAPNTYDDNDSFLDDAIMGSDQEADKEKAASEDSDWSPGAEPAEVKGAKKAKVH